MPSCSSSTHPSRSSQFLLLGMLQAVTRALVSRRLWRASVVGRVATWAVVSPGAYEEDRDGQSVLAGAVSGGWFPTAPRVELEALLWHLRTSLAPATYVGNCKNVMDGVRAFVPAGSVSSRSFYADLWRQIAVSPFPTFRASLLCPPSGSAVTQLASLSVRITTRGLATLAQRTYHDLSHLRPECKYMGLLCFAHEEPPRKRCGAPVPENKGSQIQAGRSLSVVDSIWCWVGNGAAETSQEARSR